MVATAASETVRQRGWALVCKRAVDVAVAIIIAAIGAPFFLVVTALLALTQGRPVVFRQVRAGRYEKPFVLYKFRTMRDTRGPDGSLLPDEQRVTSVGRVLRSLSIDEFPQLLNVLKGELSLIGNRPLPVEYVRLMTAEQRRRHLALPGMTGLDTVRGRYRLTWEEQFRIETWYCDHWSLLLDAQIVLQTLWVLLLNRDQTVPEISTARAAHWEEASRRLAANGDDQQRP